ncbi:GNAT family N-acetyltransferase [Novilysobacter defluvii]|uniref:GNAT family acetyltransferase n=1 Tax=Lysobacter defluvii IMMIB APB-9 = DSM 18482 TaxID=1385515 RepID=A0A0A0MA07_9GAMM|nr:GNAT family N-acetyltransferase [Lysobacter defluvii]KGO99888.1 GNAT family acetyltransferase [Lysobacter defluvii IMMIB APB-9 = DSM 18482]
MKLSLRQATNGDAPFCEALNRRNMDRYRAVRKVRWDAERFRRSWAEFDNLLILDDIEPVGLLRLGNEDGALGLRDLQVVPERQGQGIGTWAVRQTQALALERGSVGVQLRVYEENPASRLYLRLGFETRYVDDGVIHMAWTPPLDRSSAAAGTLDPRGTR